MSELALADVRVIDLTHYLAGPYCTKLLADFGADVIKIEKPGQGDGARRSGPFFEDEPNPEKSGVFLYLNTNKRGITLNLKSETGRKIFKELVKDADVLVENFEPRVLPSLGLAYETLEKINPKLVVTSISNFGQYGPYCNFKATEMTIQAMGHAMISTGVPEREPLKLGLNVCQYYAGSVAAGATMGALYFSRHQGIGQHVDLSIMETLCDSIDRRAPSLLGWWYVHRRDTRPVPAGLGLSIPPLAGPCKDGYYMLVGGLDIYWDRFINKMLGPESEFLKDPKWLMGRITDPALKEEFDAFWIPWCMERTANEIMILAQNAGVPAGAYSTAVDLLTSQHLKMRDFFSETDHPVAGKVTFPGRQFIMSVTPWQLRRSAPLLGQHNDEVYGRLGYTKEDLVELRQRGVI